MGLRECAHPQLEAQWAEGKLRVRGGVPGVAISVRGCDLTPPEVRTDGVRHSSGEASAKVPSKALEVDYHKGALEAGFLN